MYLAAESCTRPNFAKFSVRRICYLWLWLDPPLVAMQHVMYFRFCGRRYIFTWWSEWARIKDVLYPVCHVTATGAKSAVSDCIFLIYVLVLFLWYKTCFVFYSKIYVLRTVRRSVYVVVRYAADWPSISIWHFAAAGNIGLTFNRWTD